MAPPAQVRGIPLWTSMCSCSRLGSLGQYHASAGGWVDSDPSSYVFIASFSSMRLFLGCFGDMEPSGDRPLMGNAPFSYSLCTLQLSRWLLGSLKGFSAAIFRIFTGPQVYVCQLGRVLCALQSLADLACDCTTHNLSLHVTGFGVCCPSSIGHNM